MGNQTSSVRAVEKKTTKKLADVQYLSLSLDNLNIVEAVPEDHQDVPRFTPHESPLTIFTANKSQTLTFIIDHVPYDVWVPIFEAFLVIDHGGFEKLLGISRYWRSIIKGTPSLWSSISIDSKTLASPELAEIFSESTPRTMIGLEVSLLRTATYSGWVDVSWFGRYTPMIKSLKVEHGLSLRMFLWHKNFDNLATLTFGCLSRADLRFLEESVIIPGKEQALGIECIRAPNLRRVHLHDVPALIMFPIPWDQITSLTVKNFRRQQAEDFFAFLTLRFPNLRHLKASLSFWEPDPNNARWLKPICMEEEMFPSAIGKLVSLDVDFGEHTRAFFNRITLPQLEKLHVKLPRGDVEFWYKNFTLLAKRSKFPLRKVVMSNSPITLEISAASVKNPVHLIHSVLLAAPTITSLEIENSCAISYSLLKSLESPELGPSLQYLKIVNRLSEFNGRPACSGDGEERANKRVRKPVETLCSEDEDEDCDDGESEEEEEEAEEDQEKIQQLARVREAEQAKFEKKRKFMDAADAARHKLLQGSIQGMLTARHKDHALGQVITLPPSHPGFRHAAVVRARSPQMDILTTSDFEDFWVREGEEVGARETQRVHIFF